MGLYRVNMGINRDNGKENGNYYNALYIPLTGVWDFLGLGVQQG